MTKMQEPIVRISGIRKYSVESIKCLNISSRLVVKNSIYKRAYNSRKMTHIGFSKIKHISRRRMTIIIYFCICAYMPECIEAVPREDNDIIFTKHFCFFLKSLDQCQVSYSLCKDWLPKWDNLPIETEFTRIKTSLRKKS